MSNIWCSKAIGFVQFALQAGTNLITDPLAQIDSNVVKTIAPNTLQSLMNPTNGPFKGVAVEVWNGQGLDTYTNDGSSWYLNGKMDFSENGFHVFAGNEFQPHARAIAVQRLAFRGGLEGLIVAQFLFQTGGHGDQRGDPVRLLGLGFRNHREPLGKEAVPGSGVAVGDLGAASRCRSKSRAALPPRGNTSKRKPEARAYSAASKPAAGSQDAMTRVVSASAGRLSRSTPSRQTPSCGAGFSVPASTGYRRRREFTFASQ
jgi:hypothetical protein